MADLTELLDNDNSEQRKKHAAAMRDVRAMVRDAEIARIDADRLPRSRHRSGQTNR